MEEKIIIKSSEKFNTKILAISAFLSMLIFAFLTLLIYSIATHNGYYYSYYTGRYYYTPWSFENVFDAFEELWFVAVPLLLIGIVLAVIFLGFKSELVVTDKRVYGNGLFGKRVDLPIDSISSVGTTSWLSGIMVFTSSGAIKFFLLKNYQEIHSAISDLLMKRQNERVTITNIPSANNSTADELKKFKELLDIGAITQEEFDAKKKEILGI